MARNILSKIEKTELKPFAYTSQRVARLARHEQSGRGSVWRQVVRYACLVTLARLLSVVPSGLRRQASGARELAFDVVTPPNIVQVQSSSPATRYIQYRKGDKVVEPGMLIDGYTVIEGSLRLTIDNSETGEHFEELFGPGDHFGERVLLKSALRTGLVVALEDTTVLWISQKDFTRFVRAFPFLENYFKEYIDETFGGPEDRSAGQRQLQARARDVALVHARLVD